ncbi:uncharacterized protein F4812DRAFT_103735 [Daldinia caldariorum]|uniref:uncharacterized protein n=1 Tax=Daldinia caldariorum TaxID=326644 RepID=UPI002007B1FB|nr:uncharacterized protein F4812DRAFT_103735 [Daldinia caldariorum]KAI1465596.1 hypothetical protein F4812DRAFT_103735 [Daldinia caldariorum]
MSTNDISIPAGLEVAPSDLPHVVNGPTIIGNSYERPEKYAFEQPNPSLQGVAQQNAYSNGAYMSQGYPLPVQGQPHWGGSQDGTYLSDKPFPPLPSREGALCGLRPKTFWLIIGPLIAILVIGLAVGLGVGLASSHNSSSNSDGTPTSSNPSSATTSTPITCPQSNGTIYEGAGNEPFLVVCNVDYNSNYAGSGTTDIGNEETSSVEDCIDTCAGNSTCVGAGWGNYEGRYICWMKGKLGSSQGAPNWLFAIRQ